MALKFADGTSTVVTFPFGDAKEVEGTYGVQYQYSVEVEGRSDVFFASPTVHDRIQKAGVGPGVQLRITRTGEGQATRWAVTKEGQDMIPEKPPVPTGQAPAPAPSPGAVSFDVIQRTFHTCVDSVVTEWGVKEFGVIEEGKDQAPFIFSSEDIRAMAISMFMTCSQKAAWVPAEALAAAVLDDEAIQGEKPPAEARERLMASLKALRDDFGDVGMNRLHKRPEVAAMVPTDSGGNTLWSEIPGKYLDSVIKASEAAYMELTEEDKKVPF